MKKKKLRDFLDCTADQILSTVALGFLLFSMYKGASAFWAEPPNKWIVYGIMGLGFLLGCMKFFTNENKEI